MLSLLVKSECPWRPSNGSSEVKPVSGTKENKGNKFKSGISKEAAFGI